jgi:negative regulator of flagellin synthesis FlgM
MRIDLNSAAANQISSEANATPASGASLSQTGVSGSEDRTSFTSDTQSLSSLVGLALSSPEVRDEKVASLQQQVSSGTYQLDPNAIAGSMIDEHA